jgi:hypothetical protein
LALDLGIFHRRPQEISGREGGPNFKCEGEPGEIFELQTDKNKNGYSKLLTARKFSVVDQPDGTGQSS